MGDLADGEQTTVKGSGSAEYTLKNSGGVFSCTCPAWRNQSVAIERRTCKHLRALRGDAQEQERLGGAELSGKPVRVVKPAQAADRALAATGDEDDQDDEGPPLLLAHKWESSIDIS